MPDVMVVTLGGTEGLSQRRQAVRMSPQINKSTVKVQRHGVLSGTGTVRWAMGLDLED